MSQPRARLVDRMRRVIEFDEDVLAQLINLELRTAKDGEMTYEIAESIARRIKAHFLERLKEAEAEEGKT